MRGFAFGGANGAISRATPHYAAATIDYAIRLFALAVTPTALP